MQTGVRLAMMLLLLGCLLPLPYGYFMLVRIGCSAGFGYLAYHAYRQLPQKGWFLVYTILALLFQPFYKISLSRVVWNVLDMGLAILLLYTIFFPHQRRNQG